MLTICVCLVLGLLGQGADNNGKFNIPLLGFSLTHKYFFYVCIIAVVCFYVYLHTYLKHLWEVLSGLPAYFTDGTALHRKAYPWMMIHLVQWYFPRLREKEKVRLWSLNIVTPILLAWIIPVVIVAAVGLFSQSDDIGVIGASRVALAIMTIIGIVTFIRMGRILRLGTERKRIGERVTEFVKNLPSRFRR